MSECEACQKAAKEILDNPMLRGLGEMGVIVFAIQGKYHDAEIARLKERLKASEDIASAAIGLDVFVGWSADGKSMMTRKFEDILPEILTFRRRALEGTPKEVRE